MSDNSGFDYTEFGFEDDEPRRQEPGPRRQAPPSEFDSSDTIEGIYDDNISSSGDEDTLVGLLVAGLLLRDARSRHLLDAMGISNTPAVRLIRSAIGLVIFLLFCMLFACCMLIMGGLSGGEAMHAPVPDTGSFVYILPEPSTAFVAVVEQQIPVNSAPLPEPSQQIR